MSATWATVWPDMAHLWDEGAGGWRVGTLEDGLAVWACPLMFTVAVVVGDPEDRTAYLDRWCYESIPAAVQAGRAWAGPYPGTEPEGWHRHPVTGRRREGGDPATEVVAL